MSTTQQTSFEGLLHSIMPKFSDGIQTTIDPINLENFNAKLANMVQSGAFFEGTPYQAAEDYLLRAFEPIGEFELRDFQEKLKPLQVAELKKLNAKTTALFQERKVPVTALKSKLINAKKELPLRCAEGGGVALGATFFLWRDIWQPYPYYPDAFHIIITKTGLVGTLAIATTSALYAFGPYLWHGFWHQRARAKLTNLCREVNKIHRAIFDEKDLKQENKRGPGRSTSTQNRPKAAPATSSPAPTAATSLEQVGQQLQSQKARAEQAEQQLGSLRAELQASQAAHQATQAAHQATQASLEKSQSDLQTSQEQNRTKDQEIRELREETKTAKAEISQMKEFLITMGYRPRASTSEVTP